MLELVIAAWAPAVVCVLASRLGDAAARRACAVLAGIVLLWLSPCWLSGRSPVAFDYLFEDVAPWTSLEGEDYESAGSMLSDVPLQFVPWREVVTQSLRQGEIPFLNRHAAAGSPLLANPQAAPFAPATLLGLPFSSFAWPLFAASLRLLIASTGMYFFLRQERVIELASITSAVAWGFCSFNVGFLEFPHVNVSSLLPWMLLSIRLAANARWQSGVVGAACLALLIAGGHPASVLHVAFLAVPYAIWLAWTSSDRRRTIAGFSTIALLGLGLSAPLLIPFADHLPFTERVAWLAARAETPGADRALADGLLPFVFPAHLLHTASQNWPGLAFVETASQYAGIATLLLALAGFIARLERLRFWIAALVALFLIAVFGTRESLHDIPMLGWASHGRLRFVLAFIVAVGAAHGLDRVLAFPLSRRNKQAIALGATMLAAVIVAISLSNLELYVSHGTGTRVAVSVAAGLLSLAAVLIAIRKPESPARRWIPFLVALDLFAVSGLLNAPVERRYYYPETPAITAMSPATEPERMLGIWTAVFPNTGTMLGMEQVGAHDPVAFEPYLRLLEQSGYDRTYYFNAFKRLPPRALLDFLGVGYVIAPAGFPAPELPRVHEGIDAWVYLNPRALPRFFVPSHLLSASDPGGALLRSDDARAVFVRGPAREVGAAALRLVDYGASSARIEIDASSEAFIASSEVALPGWRLSIDGVDAPFELINGVFLGWTVPVGRHIVELRYRPERWELSLAIFALSAAVGLLLAARMRLSIASNTGLPPS